VAFQKPAFIAFTGVDRIEIKRDLCALAAHYPIEWGILIDDERADDALFPNAAVRTQLVSGEPLRWAAHICATQARAIAGSAAPVAFDLRGFQRAQINHSFSGSSAVHVANSALFGRRAGVRSVLQCTDTFPMDLRVDWLFDVSFGKGSRPSAWPTLPAAGPFCGFSGGLNADNVRETLERIAAPPDVPYWIDMESGIRTAGWLDVAKCEAVCRAVYDR
jgi:hypothetical protein